MKKFLLILSLILVSLISFGQVPNGSFETWQSVSYDEPSGFMTGNHESSSLGLVPVTKVNGASGHAVRMETICLNGDTAQAYITNGDPMSGEGGVPFAEQATAITGNYRFLMQGSDSGIIIVMFKKNGTIISTDIHKLSGNGSAANFTPFSFSVSPPITPDSVIIAAASSNLIDGVGITNGSFLELDGIAFANTTTPIDNGDFESWTPNSTNTIDGWETYGDGAVRTTDSYDGTYAVSFTTVDYGNGDIYSSGMTSGHSTQNGSFGGTPYTLSSDTLYGYYKYSTSASDSAYIGISLSKNGGQFGGGGIYLGAAAQYTYFEIPISSVQTPDTIRIDISSSMWPHTQSSVGSMLIIDHIGLKSEMLAGVKKVYTKASKVYPNPATEFINITLADNISENVEIEIYDLIGRLVIKENKAVLGNQISLNVSSLNSGIYYSRIVTSSGEIKQEFAKQ